MKLYDISKYFYFQFVVFAAKVDVIIVILYKLQHSPLIYNIYRFAVQYNIVHHYYSLLFSLTASNPLLIYPNSSNLIVQNNKTKIIKKKIMFCFNKWLCFIYTCYHNQNIIFIKGRI